MISDQLSVISDQLSVISYQLSVISDQLSVISYQLSVISYQLEKARVLINLSSHVSHSLILTPDYPYYFITNADY